MDSLVACLLTLNEAHQIADAISSLQRVATQILVVDSGSEDETREIAKRLGASVLLHQFDDWSTQRNWAIDEARRRFSPEWILFLDADERLSDALVQEIRSLGSRRDREDVYLIPLRVAFAGRVLRFGSTAHLRLPRLFRPEAARYDQRGVNEQLNIQPGHRVGALSGHIVHLDIDDWTRYIAKHNVYSTLEAAARVRGEQAPPTLRQAIIYPHLRGRWLRVTILNRLPARPAFRFLYEYIIRGSFLDGYAGFAKCLFVAWLELSIDMKANELQKRRTQADS